MYPIVILYGAANTGKDTVADMLVRGRNGAIVAQADPMKEFMQQVFGFTNEQLWGPSAARNAIDPRLDDAFLKEKVWRKRFGGGAAPLEVRQLVKRLRSQNALNDHSASLLATRTVAWFGGVGRDWDDGYKFRPESPRTLLQHYGTEVARNVDPDMWSKYAIGCANQLLAGGHSYDRNSGMAKDTNNDGHNLVVISDGRFRNEILNVKKMGGIAIKLVNPEGGTAPGIAGHASEKGGIPDTWFDNIIVNDKRDGLDALRYQIDDFMSYLGWEHE